MRTILTTVLVVGAFLAGCYFCSQVVHATPPCPGPVVSPPDASASSPGASPATLSVTMTINEDQTTSDRKSKVILQFSSIDVGGNNCVDFSHGETVTCNNDGTGPVQFDTNKSAYVTRVGPTGDYTCMYQQNSRSAPVLLTIPRGTLLYPEFSASNQSRLTVTYNPNNDQRLAGKCPLEIDATGSQTFGTQTIPSALNLKDTGQYTIPDISGLSGQGTLVIKRTCQFTAQHPLSTPCVCQTPTQFELVNIIYTSTATLDMNWNPTDP